MIYRTGLFGSQISRAITGPSLEPALLCLLYVAKETKRPWQRARTAVGTRRARPVHTPESSAKVRDGNYFVRN